jgi:hypothetical protein
VERVRDTEIDDLIKVLRDEDAVRQISTPVGDCAGGFERLILVSSRAAPGWLWTIRRGSVYTAGSEM